MIQNQLQIKPKTQIACSVCYRAVVLSKLRFNRKLFTLLLANSNFQVSAFRFVIFGVLFSIIYFRILNSAQRISSFGWQIPIFTFLLFTLQLFKFLLADSDFHASDFQVSVGRFRLSRFWFSSFNFLLASSNFHASALLSFCVNKCLFSNCFYLRNFGTTAL